MFAHPASGTCVSSRERDPCFRTFNVRCLEYYHTFVNIQNKIFYHHVPETYKPRIWQPLPREWRLRLRRPCAWRAGGGPPSPVGSPAELLSPLSSPFPPSFPRPLCLTCMACPGGALAHSLFFCNYLSYFTNMILDSCRLPAAKAVLAAPSPGLPHADRRLLRALLPFILVCLPSPWLPCLSQMELLIMP